jgi:uncharacterized membrane protein YhfC
MFHVKHASVMFHVKQEGGMSVSAVFFRVLNILVMLGVPLLAAGLFERKNQVGWRLFGVGAVTFVLSQVLHIPFNVFGLSAFF